MTTVPELRLLLTRCDDCDESCDGYCDVNEALRDSAPAILTALEAAKRVVQRLGIPDEFGMVEACIYDLSAALTRLEGSDE